MGAYKKSLTDIKDRGLKRKRKGYTGPRFVELIPKNIDPINVLIVHKMFN